MPKYNVENTGELVGRPSTTTAEPSKADLAKAEKKRAKESAKRAAVDPAKEAKRAAAEKFKAEKAAQKAAEKAQKEMKKKAEIIEKMAAKKAERASYQQRGASAAEE